jgi:FkbM family methyltransferase
MYKNLKNVLVIFLIFVTSIIILTYYNNQIESISNNKNEESTIKIKNNNIQINQMKEDILNEISKASPRQKLIDRQVILQTLEFMVQETKENDIELINFVKSLIVPPSNQQYNLKRNFKSQWSVMEREYSQYGQSVKVDKLLKSKRNGFFVEAGAYDGEEFSNSLFFELYRNWTGLLIEPQPTMFQLLKNKNRKSFAINACISGRLAKVSKFLVYAGLSGLDDELDKDHYNRIKENSKRSHVQVQTIYVPCFSLNTILLALGGINSIDFFSLDVEGSEMKVLENLDLKTLHIDTFAIEHNFLLTRSWNKRDEIVNFLKEYNYKVKSSDEVDVFLQKS